MVKNKIRHLLFSVQRSMLIPDEYTSSFIAYNFHIMSVTTTICNYLSGRSLTETKSWIRVVKVKTS